jgi:hypothetical protein
MERSIETDGLRVSVTTLTHLRHTQLTQATPEQLSQISDCLASCRAKVATILRGHDGRHKDKDRAS